MPFVEFEPLQYLDSSVCTLGSDSKMVYTAK